MIIIFILLIMAIIGALVVVYYAGQPDGKHVKGAPAPEPAPLPAAGRMPMLPAEPARPQVPRDADWWNTPAAAAELLSALKDEDTPQPAAPVFTAADLDETWTDLPPVTIPGPIVRDRADLIARYLP